TEDLVDLAEGTRPESSAPHLATCESCRSHLADLRAMIAAVVEADVPEPSPLFWDQLSRRVREAVEAGEARSPAWNWLPAYLLAGVALLAVIVIAAVRTFAPSGQPSPSPVALQPSPSPAAIDQNDGAGASEAWRDDVWLTFVAALAADVDADAARDEGF